MNRTEFLEFCAANDLSTVYAGRDWYEAEVNGKYLCAVIVGYDFATIKPLLENGSAYIASADIKEGNQWYGHNGFSSIYSEDAAGVAREIATQYSVFLDAKDDTTYYSAEDINERDKALADNPALPGETAEAHFERVSEVLEEEDVCLPPLYVTTPGYWSSLREEVMLSEKDKTTGIWSFGDDNWTQDLLLILNEKSTEAE